MSIQLPYRICKSCLEPFLLNNGNRYYCPSKYGKKDYCKYAYKEYQQLLKAGGSTFEQRQNFLNKHKGMALSVRDLELRMIFPPEGKLERLINHLYYYWMFIDGEFCLLKRRSDGLIYIIDEINSYFDV